jgi:Family of unknown function (DUF6464)
MDINSLPTEIHNQQKFLGRTYLDSTPQPGQYLEHDGQTYIVLERKHRYHFKAGKYHLSQMVVLVQTAVVPSEKSLVDGRWIIGDSGCRFNARSELIRCAVNPVGLCAGCVWREAII